MDLLYKVSHSDSQTQHLDVGYLIRMEDAFNPTGSLQLSNAQAERIRMEQWE